MPNEPDIRATVRRLRELPTGCGYQGYEFGAGSYPDSQCFGGRLYDMDNCDEPGTVYEPSENIPCPMCHPRKAVEYWTHRNWNGGLGRSAAKEAARSLVNDIRQNRKNGTEPWKGGHAAR